MKFENPMSHSFQKKHLQPWGLELVNKYPLIFLEKSADIACYTAGLNPDEVVNLRYGFEHGEGWKKLIDDLASTATQLVTQLREAGKDASIHGCICKEKFGGLRWQGDCSLPPLETKLWNAFFRDIETQSYNVCEITGEFGQICKRDSGWVKTLCAEEAKKLGYTVVER